MAVTVAYFFLLSVGASLFAGTDSTFNAGYFSLVDNVAFVDAYLPAAWKTFDEVPYRLKCIQLCLTQASCQSVYYDESSKSCYLNAASFYISSSNSMTGLSYVGYLLSCNKSQCLQLTDYFVPFVSDPVVYSGCIDARTKGITQSGVYYINPDGAGAFLVWCDFIGNSSYAVFQRRYNGSVDFYRGWADYKSGFGDVHGEYWLGLDLIYRLTDALHPQLNIYLEDFTGAFRNAYYESMYITNETGLFNLTLGTYSGDSGDAMGSNSGQQATGMKFSTYDNDNDLRSGGNCAVIYKGAWWYRSCHAANLNGAYLGGSHTTFADGIEWYYWTGHYYSLKVTTMRVAV